MHLLRTQFVSFIYITRNLWCMRVFLKRIECPRIGLDVIHDPEFKCCCIRRFRFISMRNNELIFSFEQCTLLRIIKSERSCRVTVVLVVRWRCCPCKRFFLRLLSNRHGNDFRVLPKARRSVSRYLSRIHCSKRLFFLKFSSESHKTANISNTARRALCRKKLCDDHDQTIETQTFQSERNVFVSVYVR